jgi:hypothetical protein
MECERQDLARDFQRDGSGVEETKPVTRAIDAAVERKEDAHVASDSSQGAGERERDVGEPSRLGEGRYFGGEIGDAESTHGIGV